MCLTGLHHIRRWHSSCFPPLICPQLLEMLTAKPLDIRLGGKAGKTFMKPNQAQIHSSNCSLWDCHTNISGLQIHKRFEKQSHVSVKVNTNYFENSPTKFSTLHITIFSFLPAT